MATFTHVLSYEFDPPIPRADREALQVAASSMEDEDKGNRYICALCPSGCHGVVSAEDPISVRPDAEILGLRDSIETEFERIGYHDPEVHRTFRKFKLVWDAEHSGMCECELCNPN